jgi:PAS domain S-box-containing protein
MQVAKPQMVRGAGNRPSEAHAHELKQVFEQIGEAVLVKDLNAVVTYWNREAASMYGFSAQEAVGQPLRKLHCADLSDADYARLLDRIRAGRPTSASTERRKKSGEIVNVTLKTTPLLDDQGKLVGEITVARDVTEQKGAERALRATEQKYQAIFENATEGIFQSTAHGQYLAANPALARIYGYASAEQLIESVNSIQTQIYVDPTRQLLFAEAIARDNAVAQFESQVHRKDGEVIWISETARGVRDSKGTLLYYEGTVIDITLRKRSEAEREELHSRLLSVSRQSGMAEVATGVLHNVGNVLNSVNVSASLVEDKLRKSKLAQLRQAVGLLRSQPAAHLPRFLTEDAKGKILPDYFVKITELLTTEQDDVLKELSMLAENIEHIKEVVQMQQTYAKVGAVTETVRLHDLLEDAIRLEASSLERHEVEIVREYESLPPVTIDKHRVLEIVVNLLRNAKQAVTEHHLRLREAGAALPPKRVTLRLARGNTGRILVHITDTGTGIAQENLTRIFSLGFTTKKKGHGLGLHTSALAAKTMGGSLSASSEGPGTGATFSLELDVKEAGLTGSKK